jgi:lambda repressor-like predicted transcriptional regulator
MIAIATLGPSGVSMAALDNQLSFHSLREVLEMPTGQNWYAQ